jgi:Fe2+ transport system protein B
MLRLMPSCSTSRSMARASLYAARIASRTVRQQGGSRRLAWQSRLDHWLTHPLTGFPVMIAVLGAVLWLTISGANAPSKLLADSPAKARAYLTRKSQDASREATQAYWNLGDLLWAKYDEKW